MEWNGMGIRAFRSLKHATRTVLYVVSKFTEKKKTPRRSSAQTAARPHQHYDYLLCSPLLPINFYLLLAIPLQAIMSYIWSSAFVALPCHETGKMHMEKRERNPTATSRA